MDINQYRIIELTERVKELEDAVFKKKKKTQTTRAQQMLLLKHLGLLEVIERFEITKKAKAELLGIILNASAENVEHDLTEINSNKSPLRTSKNYDFLIRNFSKVGLKEKEIEAENVFIEISRKG
jgi:hypothetical protein